MDDDMTVVIEGVTYVSHAALIYGDYGGEGVAAHANIRSIEQDYEAIIVSMGAWSHAAEAERDHSPDCGLGNEARKLFRSGSPKTVLACGDFGSRQLWIRQDVDEEQGYTRTIELDGVLDGGMLSKVREEWIAEAWLEWTYDEVVRDRAFLPVRDKLDAMERSAAVGLVAAAYQIVMERHNEYYEFENSTIFAPLEREYYGEVVELVSKGLPGPEPKRELKDWERRALAATRRTFFGCILASLITPEAEFLPKFAAQAVVTSDGFIMAGYTDGEGQHHHGAFVGAYSDLERNTKGLAKHLGLDLAEKKELISKVRGWIVQDFRH